MRVFRRQASQEATSNQTSLAQCVSGGQNSAANFSKMQASHPIGRNRVQSAAFSQADGLACGPVACGCAVQEAFCIDSADGWWGIATVARETLEERDAED
jgi:hypothetical protein